MGTKKIVKVVALSLVLCMATLGALSVTSATAESAEKEPLIYCITHAGAADPWWAVMINSWEIACSILPVRGAVITSSSRTKNMFIVPTSSIHVLSHPSSQSTWVNPFFLASSAASRLAA